MKLLLRSVIVFFLISAPLTAKRPPKPPKEPKAPLTAEQKEVIVAGAAQLMTGVLAIIQNPHNKHNVGNSIATMLQGIISIIIEKIGRRTITIHDTLSTQHYIKEIYQELNDEINLLIANEIRA